VGEPNKKWLIHLSIFVYFSLLEITHHKLDTRSWTRVLYKNQWKFFETNKI